MIYFWYFLALNNYKATMELKWNTQELEIVVKLNAENNKNNTDDIWCDNIELIVAYDTE